MRKEGAESRVAAAPPPKKGLVPPVLDQNIHTLRCLAQLRSKTSNLEQYIYLSHLKTEDPHMFYRLCLKHMSEITPLIYTPTVGDACQQFSQIYRRPEGMVRASRCRTYASTNLTLSYSTSPFKTKEKFALVRQKISFDQSHVCYNNLGRSHQQLA